MANRPDATEKLKKQLSIFKFEVPSFKGPGDGRHLESVSGARKPNPKLVRCGILRRRNRFSPCNFRVAAARQNAALLPGCILDPVFVISGEAFFGIFERL